MRIAVLLLGGLLAVAPTAAACACPVERMSCQGTSDCCCGDSRSSEPSHDACPRSAPAVDSFDQPSAGLEPAPPQDVVALLPLELPLPEASSTSTRAADDGLTRPRRQLLCPVLLL